SVSKQAEARVRRLIYPVVVSPDLPQDAAGPRPGAATPDTVHDAPEPHSADAMAAPAGGEPRPLLIYDGRCGFCFYWARYWRKLTGEAVDYQPYQAVAADYPEIAEAEFQRAVQYIAPDGRRASAAEASFLTLSHAPWRG